MRHSAVTLEKTEKPGWYWRVRGRDVLITHKFVRLGHHCIFLEHEGERLHVVKHLLRLRFVGLDNVRIVGSGWLPYDGSARMYRQAIEPVSYSPTESFSTRLNVCV